MSSVHRKYKHTHTASLISAWFYIHHHKHDLRSPGPLKKRSSHRALIIHPVYCFDVLSNKGVWCWSVGGGKWQIFISSDKTASDLQAFNFKLIFRHLSRRLRFRYKYYMQTFFPCVSVPGPLGCTWTRHYCTYEKGSKTFTMSSTENKSAGKQVV